MLKRLARLAKNATSRWRNSEHGSAAVEFAFVAGPFIMVLGTLIETGLMMLTEHALQSGVQDAARLVRTGQAQMSGLTATTFKAEICKTASILIDCTGSVTVYVNSAATYASLAATLPSFLNVGPSGTAQPNPTSFCMGNPSRPAAVVATYDWNFSMWGMTYFGNVAGNSARRLVGFAIFQNEPYPGTSCGP